MVNQTEKAAKPFMVPWPMAAGNTLLVLIARYERNEPAKKQKNYKGRTKPGNEVIPDWP